jgi:hypothetical protein
MFFILQSIFTYIIITRAPGHTAWVWAPLFAHIKRKKNQTKKQTHTGDIGIGKAFAVPTPEDLIQKP